MDLEQLPENRDRVDTPPCFERPALCPILVWHGLKMSICAERPFMGKPAEWWKDFILNKVYELSDEFDQFRYDSEVSVYEDE